MALAAVDGQKKLPSCLYVCIIRCSLNRSFQGLQVKHHILHGLVGYFRVGILPVVGVEMFVGGVNAHVLIVGIHRLLEQIISGCLFSKAANVFAVSGNGSWSEGRICGNAYPVWTARNSIAVCISLIGQSQQGCIRYNL